MTAISRCRLCGNHGLVTVLDLGLQELTGVFPSSPTASLTKGPLKLVKCHGEKACGLVQLGHGYDQVEMYGANYGYQSSLNRSMVNHLAAKVAWLQQRRPLKDGDVVLDIGSNDGTTLMQYPKTATLVGIDPTIAKFSKSYGAHIKAVPAFFDAQTFRSVMGDKKAAIVTSISMFYDLPEPMKFVQDVASVLADDGVWHLEQSYLPLMLKTHGYDTVCHEHLEYYALRQIQWMTSRAGLRITDVSLNDVNGGSFAVTVAKGQGDAPIVAQMISEESQLESLDMWEAFSASVARHKSDLVKLLQELKRTGKRVYGLGASTKGNVILQYCGITPELLPAIGEVNKDKFGCFTPGTHIPIISEDEVRKLKPDVLMVLPWHFREGFMAREKPFMTAGGQLLFPLPHIERVP